MCETGKTQWNYVGMQGMPFGSTYSRLFLNKIINKQSWYSYLCKILRVRLYVYESTHVLTTSNSVALWYAHL